MPQYEDREKISEFYRTLGEKAETFCQTNLKERAERSYEECDDPRKRFRYPPLVYAMTAQEEGIGNGMVSISLDVTLRQGAAILEKEIWGHVFCESDGMLLSPLDVAKRWGGMRLSRSQKKEIGGLIFRGDAIFEKQKDQWAKIDDSAQNG